MNTTNFEDLLKSGEVINVAQCAKDGMIPQQNKRYLIRIDRIEYVVDDCLTGRALLVIAGKDPHRFQLRQSVRHGQKVAVEVVRLDEKVCFTKPGIEKFMTLPLDHRRASV